MESNNTQATRATNGWFVLATPTVDHVLFCPCAQVFKAAYTHTGYAIVTWRAEYVLYRALVSHVVHTP